MVFEGGEGVGYLNGREKSFFVRGVVIYRDFKGVKNLECLRIERKRYGDLDRVSGGGEVETWLDLRVFLDKENMFFLKENNFYIFGVLE